MARNISTDIIELPVGYTDHNGKIHNLCEISEMLGSDEEAITDKKVASNPAGVITTLLSRKIVKLGDIERVTPAMVKSMYTADRDAILLGIRKLSLGNEMKFVTQDKGGCGEKSEVVVDLEHDIPTVTWADVIEKHPELKGEPIGFIPFELPVGYEDNDGIVHKRGVIRLTTGDIEERLATMIRQNPGKANTAMMTACIQSLGDLKTVDTRVLREMTRRDREYLTNLMREYKCGPDFTKEIECPFCGNSYTIQLELPYFFTANSDL